MKMGCVKNKAQFPASIGEGAEKCDRIGASGEADSKTHSGIQERGVERESWRQRAHERMIVQFSILDLC